MLYITKEDALKLWGYVEGETNKLEKRTDKLEAELNERTNNNEEIPDSFAIEYWANVTANRRAIRELRQEIKTARSEFDTITGGSVPVVLLQSLIASALYKPSITNFENANNVIRLERDAIRLILSEVLRYAIKDDTREQVTA